MQQYLTFCGDIRRPSFKDLTGTKCKDEYPGAFVSDTTETYNAMSKVKSGTAGVITTGLWPLDHESNYDWRHSTHRKTIWTQWIYMARIEKIKVDRYRPKMLRQCPPAALIRDTLAALLSPLCKISIATVLEGVTADSEPEKTFYWPDNIKVEPKLSPATIPSVTHESGAVDSTEGAVTKVAMPKPTFNVEEMRAEQSRREETEEMKADVTAIFKKLHGTKAGLAIRGRKGFHAPIVKILDTLEEVSDITLFCLWVLYKHIYKAFLDNIKRSELIEEALDLDPDAFIDPYDEADWPLDDEDTLDFLTIPKRAAPYKVLPNKGKTVTKPTPASTKSTPTATSTPQPTSKSPKSKPSVAKDGLQKRGASRGAKKIEAMKRIQDNETDDMFESSDVVSTS
jgi:hypothetical protein